MEVTAEIRSWKEHTNSHGSYFTGTIWNDSKGRWKDGTSFHTSQVVQKLTVNNDIYVVTLNSTYACKAEHKRKPQGPVLVQAR